MPPVSSPENPATFSENTRVQVLINQALPKTLTYLLGKEQTAEPGTLVQVPLGKKLGYGVVLGPSKEEIEESKLKEIKAVLELPSLKPSLLEFIGWVADYTMSPPGSVLAMALGGQSVLAAKKPRKKEASEPKISASEKHPLSAAQQKAADLIVQDVKQSHFSVTLLDGVTGSGKTEVYCEAIEAAINANKQALVLLPEIALTAQLVERLTRRFGFAPVVWHSNLTPATRRDNWKAVAERAPLVVGARSALFLPYAQLGLIVVDEEHDSSYKQEDGVVYHARDMAVVRGKIENIPVILSSATPSLETVLNACAKRYQHAHLPERHGEASMPHIHLVDLREEKMPRGGWISPTLQKAMRETLQRGEQILLFLNRRGYAPLTLCRHCGYRFACPQCSAWLVEHRSEGKRRLICHHCGYATLYPEACPQCGATDSLAACGPGVERLEEEAKRLFPQARIATLASDTQEHIAEVHQTIAAMEAGQIDILIGTQIVAKGYHFPRLTLVGVIDGDLGLSGGDLRAAEHTFQLLAQVAGRSGRVDVHGHVYIQTVQPQHAVMQNLAQYDRDRLVETLIREREKYAMPPFARLAILTLSGTDQARTRAAAQKLAQNIPMQSGVEVLGPAPAPMAMLRGRFRLRFLIKTGRRERIQDFIRNWLASTPIPPAIRTGIDVDPQHFA